MNIRILITLLFGVTLFCSCQPKQLPVNSLAERVTEGTSKDRILFRMTPEKDDVSKDYFEITAEDGKSPDSRKFRSVIGNRTELVSEVCSRYSSFLE